MNKPKIVAVGLHWKDHIDGDLIDTMQHKFYATHYQRPSKSVHNGVTWVSSITGSPCGLNPCGVCVKRNKLGLGQPPKDINPI
tara:strand:+ start:166 stop:414 length:249 start_codon:yes stop_codon:yes gene_type:complete